MRDVPVWAVATAAMTVSRINKMGIDRVDFNMAPPGKLQQDEE
jgi:hypothetical protein